MASERKLQRLSFAWDHGWSEPDPLGSYCDADEAEALVADLRARCEQAEARVAELEAALRDLLEEYDSHLAPTRYSEAARSLLTKVENGGAGRDTEGGSDNGE